MEKHIYKKIFTEAVNYGLKRRLSYEQAEDFAQRFVMSRYVIRTDQKINQAFVDYIRHEYGDNRQPTGAAKSKALKTSLEINEELLGEYEIYSDLFYWKNYLKNNLNEKQIYLIQLKAEGYTFREIGEILGVSAARAHQQFKNIKAKYLNANPT